MPLIGGTATWLGPVIGAILLGTLQQVATVTISSAFVAFIVGLLLVGFVDRCRRTVIVDCCVPRGRRGREAAGVTSDALLQVTGLGKRFGGFVALADVEFDVARR